MVSAFRLLLVLLALFAPAFAHAQEEPAPAMKAATLRPDLMAAMQKDLLAPRLAGLVDRVRASVEEDLRGRNRVDPAVVRELVALHAARVVDSERLGAKAREWLAGALADRAVDPQEADALATRWSAEALAEWTDQVRSQSMQGLEASLQGRMTATLVRFGEAFFSRSTEEQPEPGGVAVPDSYRLAPGDRLDVVVYNVKGGETTQAVTVDAQGLAFVPGVGAVQIAGLTRTQAEERLTGAVTGRFPNMRVRLELARVNPVRIFVLGEARRPGGYLLAPGSSALDALLAAGGPSDRGSYRRVEVQRGGARIAVLDLYDFLATGRPLPVLELQTQDRIFIPVKGTEVEVSGQVARPAIYELKGERTLAQVLALAGGVVPDAYSPRLQVERVSKGQDRVLVEVGLKDARATALQPGDRVMVFSVLDEITNGVFLDGPVERPGWYAWSRGMTVSDLLVRAQGLRPSASQGHAEIYRGAPGQATQVIGFRLDEALSRVNDPRLEPGDRLVVFGGTDVAFDASKVQVRGAVSRPGEYQRYSGMRVADLVGRAGGMLPEASVQAEVARSGPGGRVERLPVDLEQAVRNPAGPENLVLQDFDLLLVRTGLGARRYPAMITLSGEVARPGEYAVDPTSETLADVIRRAGGLTDRAFAKGAVFVRTQPELIDPQNRELATRVFTDLQAVARQIAAVEAARNATPSATGTVTLSETAVALPRVIDRILSTGRVPLNLEALLAGNGTQDPGLKDGDILYVPDTPRTVVVSGAVAMPSALLHTRGWRAGDYIRRTGGFTDDAAEDRVLVLRVNGELLRADAAGALEPGDLVLVPPKALVAEPNGFEIFLNALQIVTNGAVLGRILK